MRILSFDVGTRNFGICLVATEPLRIEHWEVVDTKTESRMSGKTIEDHKRALLHCLCRRPQLTSALGRGDHVVIEQQPFGRGSGSPTMNILAHVIGAYFLLQHPQATPEYTVRQVAARTKLRVTAAAFGADDRAQAAQEEPAPEPEHAAAQAAAAAPAGGKRKRDRKAEYERYKENKGKGVEICTDILQRRAEFAPWRETLSSCAKKDDLADSFLQALSQLDDEHMLLES